VEGDGSWVMVRVTHFKLITFEISLQTIFFFDTTMVHYTAVVHAKNV
jgi:hypothetical protein